MAPFQSIAELIERSLSIRHVYGEPVRQGETTVIPVAQVSYAFGGGGGRAGKGIATDAENVATGSGGGGMVRMTPVGALEISPEGTRFVRVRPLGPLFGALAIGLVAGWLLSRRA